MNIQIIPLESSIFCWQKKKKKKNCYLVKGFSLTFKVQFLKPDINVLEMKVYIAQVHNTKLMKNSNGLSSLLQQSITSPMIQSNIWFEYCVSFFFFFMM